MRAAAGVLVGLLLAGVAPVAEAYHPDHDGCTRTALFEYDWHKVWLLGGPCTGVWLQRIGLFCQETVWGHDLGLLKVGGTNFGCTWWVYIPPS